MAEAVIALDTEAKVWETLRSVLDGVLSAEDVTLDFSNADWARFKIKLTGKPFDQSLTAPVMMGIVDYQNAFYKSVGLLLKNDTRRSKLNDTERSRFELIFKVGKGSSDVESEGKDSLVSLATALSKKMTGKQVLIAILACSTLYFGNAGFAAFLNHESEIAKGVDQKEELQSLADHDERMIETLRRAAKASDLTAEIQKQNYDGYQALVKRSSEAESIEIQGTPLSSTQIDSINRSTRRSAKDVTVKERVRILAVDSSHEDGFVVKVEIIDDGAVLNISMFDPVTTQKFAKVIRSAEWDKKPIFIEFSARLIGESFQDTKMLRAWTPRKKSEPAD